jgi:serine/threonine protein kinase
VYGHNLSRSYHDSFTCSGTLNIVMDYADGGDLSQFLTVRARSAGGAAYLPEDLVVHIFAQIVCGL